MTKFEVGRTYTARSICDYNCIYTIKIISRTEKTVTYIYDGNKRRSKLHFDDVCGNEWIMPDNYSMAPIFRSENIATEPEETPAEVEEKKTLPTNFSISKMFLIERTSIDCRTGYIDFAINNGSIVYRMYFRSRSKFEKLYDLNYHGKPGECIRGKARQAIINTVNGMIENDLKKAIAICV